MVAVRIELRGRCFVLLRLAWFLIFFILSCLDFLDYLDFLGSPDTQDPGWRAELTLTSGTIMR